MAAKRYTATATGISFATIEKSLLALFNGSATNKIAVYKVWMINAQTSAVTGVLTQITLNKLDGIAGGVSITPLQHDSSDQTKGLDDITCVTNGTLSKQLIGGVNAILRRWIWSTDEPTVTSASYDEWELIPGLTTVYETSNPTALTLVQPIVLNQNEGISITQLATASNVGIVDLFIEFGVY